MKNNISETKNFHWADIYAALLKNGSSGAEIARQENVSRTSVSNTIKGHLVSHKIAFAISDVTGIPTEKMWPGVYLSRDKYKELRNRQSKGRFPKAANQ